jgi:hypothetical protein
MDDVNRWTKPLEVVMSVAYPFLVATLGIAGLCCLVLLGAAAIYGGFLIFILGNALAHFGTLAIGVWSSVILTVILFVLLAVKVSALKNKELKRLIAILLAIAALGFAISHLLR